MMTRISRAAAALAAFAIAGAAGIASASAGNGIRLGGTDGRLHPFLDYETRYDSNVSYGETDTVGDMVMHIRPGLEFKAPGDLAVVEFSAEMDWAQYLGLSKRSTQDLSRLYATAGLAALVNPNGALALRVDDDFRRQVSTSFALGSPVIANSNTLLLSMPFKPGGGALILAFRGEWTLESFQQYLGASQCASIDLACSTSALGDLGYNDLRAGMEAQWRFLPRTSAVFQGGFFTHVPNATEIQVRDPATGAPAPFALPDVSGVDFHAGVTGLVTPHVGVTLKLGYGRTLESSGNLSALLADAEAEWMPLESVSLRGGFSRTFGVDPMASVYTTTGGYLTGRARALQRYAVTATVRYDRLAFERLDATAGFVRIEPGVEAMISKWLKATVGYSYTHRGSSLSATTQMPLLNALVYDYSKNEAWLKLGVTY